MGDPEPATSSDSRPNVRSGALFSLPPPPLDIHASNATEKWKEFEQAWTNYAIAMKLQQEDDRVQVATLLTVPPPPQISGETTVRSGQVRVPSFLQFMPVLFYLNEQYGYMD